MSASLTKYIIAFITIYSCINIIIHNQYNKTDTPIKHDHIAYYAYLPAFFIYGDHHLEYEFIFEGNKNVSKDFFPIKMDDGKLINKVTIGMSILYAPFFLIAHTIAAIGPSHADGYSYPYKLLMNFSGLFYLIVGLFFIRNILRKYFTETITACTIILITLGTNLYYYATMEGMMPHVHNFTLFAVFLYYTIKWHEKPSLKLSAVLGLTIGLITLIRPTNVLVAMVFVFWDIKSFRDVQFKIKLFLKEYQSVLAIVLLSFLVLIPQFMLWKHLTGSWLFYSYGDEGFDFKHPQIINALFSYKKGWLLYSPIMVFALMGILFLRKNVKEAFLPIIIFISINIYVLSSWWSWWFGGGFGHRAMIDSYALLCLPLAAFLCFVSKYKIPKFFFGTLLVILLVFSQIQTIQYKKNYIHWSNMSKEVYWDIFLRLHISWEERQKIWENLGPHMGG